jgi:hypothetical protein
MISQPHIYRRKIIATGKYYIGKHNGNNKWYKGSGVDWLKDYKIYVKNPMLDLYEEILEIITDISQLDIREEYWLKKVDAANNPLYYNKTNRSRGWIKVTDEQKNKISKSKKGKKMSKESSKKKRNKMIGIPKHTIESKRKIGEKNSKPNPKISEKLKNKEKTEEHKQKLKEAKKLQTNWRPADVIIQYDLEGNFIKEWSSIKEASYIHKGSIRDCCIGRQKTAGGYIWKYKEKKKNKYVKTNH